MEFFAGNGALFGNYYLVIFLVIFKLQRKNIKKKMKSEEALKRCEKKM